MSNTFDSGFLADVHRDMLRSARLQLHGDALAEDVVQEAIAGGAGAASRCG